VGGHDLYLLMLVCVVGWMLSGAVVVWWWELLICVRDNSWVVGWLRPRHPVSCGLRLRAVPCWMRTVFVVEQTVKFVRLLRPSSASTTGPSAAALGGIILVVRGLTSGVLVGDVVYLLLATAVLTGFCLRQSRPRAAGLRRAFGFPLGLDLALVELFGSGVLLEQLIQLLEVLGWISDALAVKDASPKATDGIVNGYLVIDRRKL
jgi:hypothetical protein